MSLLGTHYFSQIGEITNDNHNLHSSVSIPIPDLNKTPEEETITESDSEATEEDTSSCDYMSEDELYYVPEHYVLELEEKIEYLEQEVDSLKFMIKEYQLYINEHV